MRDDEKAPDDAIPSGASKRDLLGSTTDIQGKTPSEKLQDVPGVVKTYDTEVEQALLGSILCDNRLLDEVAPILKPEHWYDPMHRRFYVEMLRAKEHGVEILDPFTLEKLTADDPGLRELKITGRNYFINCATGAPALPNSQKAARDVVKSYAGILIEHAARRVVIQFVKDINFAVSEASSRVPVATLFQNFTDAFALLRGTAMIAAKNDAFIFDGDAVLEPPDMLVEGLLPKEGVVFIGGQSGVGKSFVEIDLAHSLATGKPFFGHKIKQRVGVAIVAAEGAAHIALRIAAVRMEKSPEFGVLPIAWISNAPPMNSDMDVEAFAKRLREVDVSIQKRFGISLGTVSVDTVAAAFDLEDENDNSEAARTIDKARELGRAAGVLVELVHHYGKSPVTGLRGASAWRGGADVVLSVLGEPNELTGKIANQRLVCSKNRDGEEGPIGGFTLRKVTVGIAADGTPYGSCVVDAVEQTGKAASTAKLSDRQRNALTALVELTLRQGQPVPASFGLPPSVMAVPIDVWRKELEDRGVIPDDDPNPSTTWARIREGLKAKGRAAERDGLIWPV